MLNAEEITHFLFLNDRHCILIQIWKFWRSAIIKQTVAITTVQHIQYIECEGPPPLPQITFHHLGCRSDRFAASTKTYTLMGRTTTTKQQGIKRMNNPWLETKSDLKTDHLLSGATCTIEGGAAS